VWFFYAKLRLAVLLPKENSLCFQVFGGSQRTKASELTSESCKEANVDLLWKILNWKLASSF
jgi:hypothetical protein